MIAYKIADIGFGFETSVSAESQYFGAFRIEKDEFDSLSDRHLFTFPDYDAPDENFGKRIYDGDDYSVYSTPDGFVKITERFDGENYKCLSFRRNGFSGGELFFTGKGKTALRTSAELFRLTDFFSSLLFYNAFLFHASVVESGGKAYIFSGRSGIGKSTQAELWRKHNGAKVLNGDRVILRKVGGEWRAYGTPMCGSSDICELFSLPVGAIIYLGQGKENTVTLPDTFNKLGLTLSQINFVQYDSNLQSVFTELTGSLISEVKMINYTCTAQKEAATELRKYLGI